MVEVHGAVWYFLDIKPPFGAFMRWPTGELSGDPERPFLFVFRYVSNLYMIKSRICLDSYQG